jgi:hypothetical protein
MFHFISHHKVKQHNTSPKRRINTENFIHPEYMVVNEVSKGPSAHYHTLYCQPATQCKDQVARVHLIVCSNITVPTLPIVFSLY